MARFLLICLAGGIGTGTRYLVSLGAARFLPPTFPYGTLIVNLVGCFLIAAVMQAAVQSSAMSDTVRLTLTTGFLGGLTTYSAFDYEVMEFFSHRAWATGVLYLVATVGGCFVMGVLGVAAAQRLHSP